MESPIVKTAKLNPECDGCMASKSALDGYRETLAKAVLKVKIQQSELTASKEDNKKLVEKVREPIKKAIKEKRHFIDTVTYLEYLDELLADASQDKCQHEWIDATNEVVSGTDLCKKCYAVRPTPTDTSQKEK